MASRRTTKQRQLILDIVSDSKSHPAADQVYDVAKRAMPAISLGTVYRNLRLLVEEGKLREVQFAGDVTRYDGMLDRHEHFYCRSCRKVIDLPSRLNQRMIRDVERAIGVQVDQYRLDYQGICAACAAQATQV